ncbi:MAG: tRNA epoxyqueuosine(34) reductase QueG [Desulfatiglans sp.]|jgi:epoxyqueuosine reductase|nr:tRNA epoxyqueuosine(34) reductase QueG [Desulfatiglans sp.]
MIERLRARAFELGFIATGFSRPVRPLFFDEYRSWASSGRNGGMLWMQRNMGIREDPTKLLSGCRTIISLACPYPAEKPATEEGYTLARYSTPLLDDYHTRLKSKCRELSKYIEEIYEGAVSRILVDSAPILERSYAFSGGIGFIGKNNMLIIPGYGSYFYLAEILTTALVDFPATAPNANLCGSCTACIDACQTGALKGANDFNSSLCLSYLTIESEELINPSMGKLMNRCFLGCDICQEVCPFNKSKPATKCMPSVKNFMDMADDEFLQIYGKTALSRPGLKRIRANIKALCESG